MTFRQDRLENEKNDPVEASSLKFVNIPVVLISLFVGFGVSYLAMKTKDTAMNPGDSRTVEGGESEGRERLATGNAAENKLVAPSAVNLAEKGKQVFTSTCQACHQANGAGIPGAFPPLTQSDWVNGPAQRFVAIILHGLEGEITVKGEKFEGVMPPFKDQLSSEEIAAVATYVRSSFGNQSEGVTAQQVDQVREKTKTKTGSWNGEAELKNAKWD